MKFSHDIANRIFYMDDGIIYEEGTPEQIFEHPVKEKTRAFVKMLRTWEYTICSKNFDLYSMNTEIEEFGRIRLLSDRQIYTIQLLIEEIVVNHIIKKTQDIRILAEYYEAEGRIELSFDYGGEEYNPYNTDSEDILSMLLARQLTLSTDYIYGERNLLKIKLNDSKTGR